MPLVQFIGVTILAVLAVGSARVFFDLIVNGEQLVREKREAGEETVFVGMYVDKDNNVIVRTKKRKDLWKFWK